jgi:hypothetical protein
MKAEILGKEGEESEWMKKKLRKKPSGKGLRADATVENIREGENTNRKTPHKITVSCMLLENDPTERKPENGSRRQN